MGHVGAMLQQFIVTIDAQGRKLGVKSVDGATVKQDMATIKQTMTAFTHEVAVLRGDVNSHYIFTASHGTLISKVGGWTARTEELVELSRHLEHSWSAPVKPEEPNGSEPSTILTLHTTSYT